MFFFAMINFKRMLVEYYMNTYVIKLRADDDVVYFYIGDLKIETTLKKSLIGNGVRIGCNYYSNAGIPRFELDDE